MTTFLNINDYIKKSLIGKILVSRKFDDEIFNCKIKDAFIGVSEGDRDPGFYLVLDNEDEDEIFIYDNEDIVIKEE